MKIYIYRELLSPSFIQYYNDLYQKNSFSHHYHWFNDLINIFQEFETTNSNEADYFFIPIFILPFQFKNFDLSGFINNCAFLEKGNHLIFSSGDFGQRKKSIHEGHHAGRAYSEIYDWLDERFILIALESTQDLLTQDIPIFPYQYIDPIDRRNKTGTSPSPQRRDLLYAFSGAISYAQLPIEHVRGGLLQSLSGHGNDWFIGTPQQAAQLYGEKDGANDVIFDRSIFTLCPAGFGRWTFRWIEALLSGSIPVIISDGYKIPFSEYIDWNNYVTIISENDFHNIDEILRSFPCGKMLSLLNKISQDRHLFTRQSCLNLLIKRLLSDAEKKLSLAL